MRTYAEACKTSKLFIMSKSLKLIFTATLTGLANFCFNGALIICLLRHPAGFNSITCLPIHLTQSKFIAALVIELYDLILVDSLSNTKLFLYGR